MRSFIQTILLTILSAPVLASQGVLEINQTCAVETGCFPGDTPGLPVFINAAGSYRLTSNLVAPNEDTGGISINADNVSIDLAGFEIRGPVECSGFVGSPVSCTPSFGQGSGVRTTTSAFSGHTVRNGSIRGMGGTGVALGDRSAVSELRVWSNAVRGIFGREGTNVSRNTVYVNGSDGISVDDGSTVSGNTIYLNGVNGISADDGSTILGNTVYDNRGHGIVAGEGSTVSGNTVLRQPGDGIDAAAGSNVSENATVGNGFAGIRAAIGSSVVGNTTRENTEDGISAGEGVTIIDNTSSENGDDGIAAGAGSMIRGNTVRGNGTIDADGKGLILFGDAVYRGNVITDNDDAVSGGTNLGDNFCSGTGASSASCP